MKNKTVKLINGVNEEQETTKEGEGQKKKKKQEDNTFAGKQLKFIRRKGERINFEQTEQEEPQIKSRSPWKQDTDLFR